MMIRDEKIETGRATETTLKNYYEIQGINRYKYLVRAKCIAETQVAGLSCFREPGDKWMQGKIE